jgi:hypothetical protein
VECTPFTNSRCRWRLLIINIYALASVGGR